MDLFDIHPQKFYLLSPKKRTLIDFSKADHSFAQEVDDVFDRIRALEGGNIQALYCYTPLVLESMQALAAKYKDQYPNVQQLPKYFKDFEEGDYFIRQRTSVSILDLKRSILETDSRTLGIDVKKTDDIFVQNWGLLCLSYDVYSFGFLTDKVYVGEKDESKRICRFCKGTGKERFKKTSHALQEGLGNHLLFAYEECDDCNQYFSNSVETPLFRFLETSRNLSQVRGKRSAIHNQEGLNFHIHPDNITKQPVVYVKQEHIYNDEYQGKLTGKILLYNNGSITYQGIYKALVKFAVDMIPSDKINHFARTGEWVHGDFDSDSLPSFIYGEQDTFFFEQPVLDLFFRNETSPVFSPYCTAVLYIFDSIFIYILPFSDVDTDLSLSAIQIRTHLEHFKKHEYIHVPEWVEYDSNDISERAAHYKIPVLGISGKYSVEYRPSSDLIFEIKRR